MKQLWQRYAGRVDALSLRERVMVFAAAVALVLASGYVGFLEAQGAKQKRLTSALQQKQGELKALQEQITKLFGARGGDPDRDTRERLTGVRQQLADVEAAIAAEERKFTAPAQMREVVEGLLARNRAVSLVELKTLPVANLAGARATPETAKPAPEASKSPTTAKPSAQTDRLIYRHGIELTVSGAYPDLLAYVRDLEGLPSQLYWGSLEIDGAGYPKVVMKLTVYTLSLDRSWLNV
jgi:MSHA biogenesis protein MshJ